MKDTQIQIDLITHYVNILDDEIVDFIKQLRCNEKMDWHELYNNLVEKYPQFKVNVIGEKYTKKKREQGRAVYAAAVTYYQNRTKLEVWERW
jgi:hypothetical protein